MNETIKCDTPTNTLFAALEKVEGCKKIIVLMEFEDPENKDMVINKSFVLDTTTLESIFWMIENYKFRMLNIIRDL